MKMKVLYFTCLENTHGNDIHSNQVLGLSGHGVNYKYFFLSPLFILNKKGFSLNKNKFANPLVKEVKIPILSYHLCMHVVIIPYFLIISLIPFFIRIFKEKPDIVHCRNLVSSFLAVFVRSLCRLDYKVVCDPRSVYVEECVITRTFRYNGINYLLWKHLERWIYKHSDSCIGLSEYFKDYLYQYNQNSYFIPAIVNDNSKYSADKREKIRSMKNLSKDDVVFCYIGSIDLWHSAEKLIYYFDYIIEKLPPTKSFKIVFLSGNKMVSERIVNKYGQDTIIKAGRVEPSEVLDYLLLSDFGLVPGSDNEGECYDLLYKTMISSKAEEYLVAGLPIFVNNRIVSLADLVVKYKAGVISNDTDIFKEFDRNYISRTFVEMFGVSHVVNIYNEMYKGLLE